MTKTQERMVERVRAFIEREDCYDGYEITEWSVTEHTYGTVEVMAKIGRPGRMYLKWKQIFIGRKGALSAFRDSRAPKHLQGKHTRTRVTGHAALFHSEYSF